MDQHEACDFCRSTVASEAELSALLDASPIEHGLQEGLHRIGCTVQKLCATADTDH